MTLNAAQTIFSLLFGIYFAISIPLTGKFQPFDTPSIMRGDGRALLRLLFSFAWLDMLPVFYYVLVLNWLSLVQITNLRFGSVLAMLMFSLTGFGFYRMYFGLMIIKLHKNYIFYGKKLPKTLSDEWEIRPDYHRESRAHFIPGLIWVLITTCWGLAWLIWSASSVSIAG